MTVNFRRWRLPAALVVLAGLVSVPGTPTAAAATPRQRVEIEAERTETAQVFAEPDGSRTLELHARPVRVRSGGGWREPDVTLRPESGGRVAPVAAALPISFSGGGLEPLARLGRAEQRLELSWPKPLPAPRLSGATATYPEVLPGVDLRVTAQVSGFGHVLVVRNAEAARQPALRQLRFGLRTTGLSVTAARDGGLTAADEQGRTVFQAPPAQMWDSPDTVGPRAAGAQAKRITMPVRVTDGELVLTPDAGMLADPATRFPVEIDPGWDAEPGGWALVYGIPAAYRNQSYWLGDGDGIAKVGYSNWETPTVQARSYFQYDIRHLKNPRIVLGKSSFTAFNSYSPKCEPRPVQLWQTNTFEKGYTWETQPAATMLVGTHNVARGYSANCPADWLGWDIHTAAVNAVNGNGFLTLMLRAENENDPLAWKKFHTNPKIAINYNTYPDQPVALTAEGKGCAVQPAEPHVKTTTPQLAATLHDPDGGNVAAEFEWFVRGAARPVGSHRTSTQNSGTPFTATIPHGAFADGARIGWRVRAFDGELHSQWSPWCDVTLDLTPPATAPTVESTDYPREQAGGGIGLTGRFALSAPGEADIDHFLYRLTTTNLLPVQALDGKATIALTPPRDSRNVAEIYAVDRAGNVSPKATYEFFVRSTRYPPVQHWRLDGAVPATTVPDALGRGSTGTFTQGPVSWTEGRDQDALLFDGRDGHVGFGPKSTVHTGDSFSVSAWVRLDRLDGPWQTAVSQRVDGGSGSSFYLQYRTNPSRWAFTMPEEDKDNFLGDRAEADVPVRQGVWTHLVGVYDAAAEVQLKIYVDGRFAGAAKHTKRWHRAGEVQIGRAQFNRAETDHWQGAIDDVRIYHRVLSDGRINPADKVADGSDIHTLATKPAKEAGLWAAEESAGNLAADTSGNYRGATLHGGAAWGTGKLGSGLRLDGVDDHLSTAGPAVRTDQSFTVSGWARVDSLGAESMTMVSQDGTHASGFSLGYDGARGRWAFGMSRADTTGAVQDLALDTEAPRPGEWTHLAGRYDAAAEEIRIFVNGRPGGVQRFRPAGNAEGPLRIGRAQQDGGPVRHWRGELDELRVTAGLRTEHQFVEEHKHPAIGRPVIRDGLNRYYGHNRDHFTTGGSAAGGLAPPGYRLEHELGWFAPTGAPGTVTLYSCRTGTDQFTSGDPGCEGFPVLAKLGSIYRDPPAGQPSVPLLRCRTENGEHFESVHPDCEGKQVEHRLGYLRPYGGLVRYLQQDGIGDHLSGLGGVPTGYREEFRLGILPLAHQPGTVPLESCLDGADAYTSLSTTCDGKTKLRTLGWIHTAPPAGQDSTRLLRCRRPDGERFDSVDPLCEGHQQDAVLGHLLTRI
ncbi:hypothetical protein JOF53_001060 [Crossiella equi]|uniref:LamG-like jellyroll fold domain-containing protein n=1 Tax=Crossiella equi TaxID=130796 RepID=A0ABS5A6G3_9PSEU|nr:LamG-like jellyroll fold domain-containing protein [Crossiella equi]MBP2472188.1 hypothetical protein [Crossiella equi]